MILGAYFLALAGLLLLLNLHIRRSSFAKWASYLGMWAAIITSVLVVTVEALSP